MWDDENFYVSFWIEEPFIEAHQTERDSLVFLENDVEVFIDGGDCYYEFEINALGTVYEVFFVWRDAESKFDAAGVRRDPAEGAVVRGRLRQDRCDVLARHASARAALGVSGLGLFRGCARR